MGGLKGGPLGCSRRPAHRQMFASTAVQLRPRRAPQLPAMLLLMLAGVVPAQSSYPSECQRLARVAWAPSALDTDGVGLQQVQACGQGAGPSLTGVRALSSSRSRCWPICVKLCSIPRTGLACFDCGTAWSVRTAFDRHRSLLAPCAIAGQDGQVRRVGAALAWFVAHG